MPMPILNEGVKEEGFKVDKLVYHIYLGSSQLYDQSTFTSIVANTKIYNFCSNNYSLLLTLYELQ